ncbi:MAG: DUF6273 domain-containing protein [Defluviitaleaceae bacterium]|nr:DUF6273 domain-containing protein [Defluviitaleaceae bacterium]
MKNNKEVISLFLKRGHSQIIIGTLEPLENGGYNFLINVEDRELLKANHFPFDSYFNQNETERKYQSLPSLFRKFIPERAEDIRYYGITNEDSEWQILAKAAKYGNPKGDSTQIQVMPDIRRIMDAPQTTAKGKEIIKFGGIDWVVLDVCEGRKLLLSYFVRREKFYHRLSYFQRVMWYDGADYDPLVGVTWENSVMRRYLNEEFYNGIFTDEEKAQISTVTLKNNDNPWYDTNGGNDTEDKIFLLSIDEVIKYLGNSKLIADIAPDVITDDMCDEYSPARAATNIYGIESPWALRTPGESNNEVAFVNGPGCLDLTGRDVQESFGIRPAMWVYM